MEEVLYIANKYFIGEIFKNRHGQSFEIIDYLSKAQYRKIRFIKSGYECELYMCKQSIATAYDYGSPTIHGVGTVGFKGAKKHPLYNRWVDMISRVHNKDDISYKNYGGKGVTIDDDWYYFPNYIRDISKKDNYEKLVKDSKDWSIDKDLSKSKIYSDATTVIITKSENSKERVNRKPIGRGCKIIQFNMDGKIIKKYKSITQAAKETGIKREKIIDCCKHKINNIEGCRWEYDVCL